MNRRNFIRRSGVLLAAGCVALPAWAKPQKQIPLGVQLFSVRNFVNRDFDNTIAKIAEMGYKYIEAAGYNRNQHTIHGQSPMDFRQKMASNNLVPLSAHVGFSLAAADAVLDDYATVGVKYLVCPSPRGEFRKSAQGYYSLAEELNGIGEKAKARGILFGYHNHGYEFTPLDGEIPYDILLDNTDVKNVFFQPDLGWMVRAGHDPVAYFKKYPKRFPLWHVRDIDTDNASCVVGQGKVDFKTIFAHKELAGFDTGIVETQPSPTGMSNIEQSLTYLKENKLY